jgi:hypothetical protein
MKAMQVHFWGSPNKQTKIFSCYFQFHTSMARAMFHHVTFKKKFASNIINYEFILHALKDVLNVNRCSPTPLSPPIIIEIEPISLPLPLDNHSLHPPMSTTCK